MKSVKKKPKRLHRRIVQLFRRTWFSTLSSIAETSGQPIALQPLLMEGSGKITFGRNVRIGVQTSPGFWTGYTYLECRRPNSEIRIGDEIMINNGFSVIAETTSVIIGQDCLIGHDVYIVDSDFLPLDPQKRRGHASETQRRKVQVGNNVFIGAHA
jgi:maltose O-acetyltransferase